MSDLPKVTLTADMPIIQRDEDRINVMRRQRSGQRVVRVTSLPREMFTGACERQCQQNQGQTLDRIRERKGFGAAEAVVVLAGINAVDWLPPPDEAHRILYAMVALMNRGRRLAEAEMREPA